MKTALEQLKERIPEPRAIENLIALATEMERLLREIHHASNGNWDEWIRCRASDWSDDVDRLLAPYYKEKE